MNFNKNDLINDVLDNYYGTFNHTLDTADFVPEKFNKKINLYIFKNMKKAFKKIDKEDKVYQKKMKKVLRTQKRLKRKERRKQNHIKRKEKILSFKTKIKLLFKTFKQKLFKRKKSAERTKSK